MAKDLVCGMNVDENALKSNYKGKMFCFCSSNCKSTFDKNPKKFVK